MKKTVLLLSLLFISISLFAQTNWSIDRGHSNITFTVSHMVVAEVDGSFEDFEGTVVSTTNDFNDAKVNFTAKVESVNTGSAKRDSHLKSDDFFNAEQFPEIKFDGKISKEGSKYYLIGDFTMRDVTKSVKFDLKYNGTIEGRRGKIAGFKVSGVVNRFDYKLKWDSTMETGGLVVGEDVEITCKIELRENK